MYYLVSFVYLFFFSSRRRHTRCALVTGVQTCALPILLTTSVTGSSFTRTDNTVDQPDWSGRFTATYINGGFRASYQLAYLDSVLWQPDATIESKIGRASCRERVCQYV